MTERPQNHSASSEGPLGGRVIAGKYQALRRLGEGGMGTVYEAQNLLTLKRVALKRLHVADTGRGSAGRQRVLREARAMARIHHPHVVEVYDVILDDDQVYLVMELLEGETLAEHLVNRPLALDQLIALLLPVMEGAAAAHDAGIVHRDVKPENVFLARDRSSGELRSTLIDFGISQMADAGVSRLTQSGTTMGTPRYVSYEQLCGAHGVDGRADVYSFGVMLYECAVGAPPYDARSLPEQAVLFVTSEPVAPRVLVPRLPQALADAIAQAIAKLPEERTPTLRALIDALAPYADADGYAERLVAFAPARLSQPTGAADVGARTEPGSELSGPVPVTGAVPSLPGPQPVRPRRSARWSMAAAAVAGALLLARAPRAHPAPSPPRPLRAPPITEGDAHAAAHAPLAAPSALPVTSAEVGPSAAALVPDAPALDPPGLQKETRGRRPRTAPELHRSAAETDAHTSAQGPEMLAPAPDVAREVVLHRADSLHRNEF
jgi:eukaryotic-like serine/threonine-protein kinase